MTTSPRPYPNPNSRFQIIPSPILSPGKCMICGSPNRTVVDFGLELDVNGYAFRVYVCILCMEDASSQVGGYLESIGQGRGGTASPAQIESYLLANNLKVISDEQYDNLVFWTSGLSGLVDAILDLSPTPEEDSAGESRDDAADDADAKPDDSDDDRDFRVDDDRSPSFNL